VRDVEKLDYLELTLLHSRLIAPNCDIKPIFHLLTRLQDYNSWSSCLHSHQSAEKKNNLELL